MNNFSQAIGNFVQGQSFALFFPLRFIRNKVTEEEEEERCGGEVVDNRACLFDTFTVLQRGKTLFVLSRLEL